MLSTGRTRSSSSGSASSQRRSVASCRSWRSRRDRELDQVRRPLEVLAGQRVADGLGPLAVLLVPLARPPVQLRDAVGLLVEQARPQHVGEQVVVAIPLAPVVERDEEQVRPIERLQHGLAAVLAGDGIAQRAAQPVQDRGLQQEAPDVLGLALQDLLDQVVDDVAVVPGEAGDEAGDVVAPLHRERRQLECGDPAFGARLQRGDVPRRQGQPHHLVEVGGGLVRREAQVGGADLDELAARPQAGQRQRRVGAGGDHQVHLRGQVVEQERHPVVDVGRVDRRGSRRAPARCRSAPR